MEHKKLVHYGNTDPRKDGEKPENIKCFICEDSPSFLGPEGLKFHESSEEHKTKVNSRISVHCNMCREKFEGKVEALQEHLKGQKHEDEIKSLGDYDRAKFCVPCRKEFSNFKELKKHEAVSSEHLKTCRKFKVDTSKEDKELKFPIVCHACPKVFKIQKALERHVKQFHSIDGHKCKVKLTFRNVL